jgi:hypothetical protein
MKYIKLFEEVDIIDENEFRDYCEMNLAYFLDDNSVKLNIINYQPRVTDWFGLQLIFESTKSWSEISDYIIPFYYNLEKNYNLKGEGLIHLKNLLENGITKDLFYSIKEGRFRSWGKVKWYDYPIDKLRKISQIEILLDTDKKSLTK